jgi:hypothetical protein
MFTPLFAILATPARSRPLGYCRDLLGAEVTYECPGSVGRKAA